MGLGEQRIVQLAAQQELGQRMAQPFADAQLALTLPGASRAPAASHRACSCDRRRRRGAAGAAAPPAPAQSVRAICSISYASITSAARMSL